MQFYFIDNRQTTFGESTQQLLIPVERGYLFGDGFFTTGILIDGEISHLNYHRDRLIESANRLKFESFDIDQLCAYLNQKLIGITDAVIRITVTRANLQRGYRFELTAPINVSVILSPLPEIPTNYCQLVFAQTPITINPMFAGLKHLNRLDNIFAAQEVSHPSQESLMCDGDQFICGSRSNLFIMLDNEWLTPKLDRAGVVGITRRRLIHQMRLKKIAIREADINKKQLLSCSAALMTNSLIGIWPVGQIEERILSVEPSESLKKSLNFAR